MLKKILLISGLLACSVSLFSQAASKSVYYRGILYRQDGKEVIFNILTKGNGPGTRLYIKNAAETIHVKDLEIKNDSINFRMPVFESEFKTKVQPDGSLKGIWYKGTSGNTQEWPFTALKGKRNRFDETEGKAKYNISGRWSVSLTRANGTKRPAVAEFIQKGNLLTGTFLTPSGDYRYLEGIVTGSKLFLSTFDGAHAYTFNAKIESPTRITDGFFGSGFTGAEPWEAVKNDKAALPDAATPRLKDGFSKLDFSFKSLAGEMVSINDQRFKNKVVVIQIMGSWCPNCMDETRFLSEYYDKNREKGVEVISLAYEYSTDFQRSQKSLQRFQKLFNVQYPMLITGATNSDTLKTAKTLPQLTEIAVFPTTIFLDKKGNVSSIHTGFYGPGSGKHFEEFKTAFYSTVDGLLKKEE